MKLSEIFNLWSWKSTHIDYYQIKIRSEECYSTLSFIFPRAVMVMVTAQGRDWLKICLIEQDLVKSLLVLWKWQFSLGHGDKSILYLSACVSWKGFLGTQLYLVKINIMKLDKWQDDDIHWSNQIINVQRRNTPKNSFSLVFFYNRIYFVILSSFKVTV